MHKLIILLALLGLSLQCETQSATPDPESKLTSCGVKNPAKELPWLKDIIEKAEKDKESMAYKGNYRGTIYLESLRGQPVFLVQMMMGSGGLAGYLFRCDGERIYPTPEEITTDIAQFQKQQVVYTNFP